MRDAKRGPERDCLHPRSRSLQKKLFCFLGLLALFSSAQIRKAASLLPGPAEGSPRCPLDVLVTAEQFENICRGRWLPYHSEAPWDILKQQGQRQQAEAAATQRQKELPQVLFDIVAAFDRAVPPASGQQKTLEALGLLPASSPQEGSSGALGETAETPREDPENKWFEAAQNEETEQTPQAVSAACQLRLQTHSYQLGGPLNPSVSLGFLVVLAAAPAGAPKEALELPVPRPKAKSEPQAAPPISHVRQGKQHRHPQRMQQQQQQQRRRLSSARASDGVRESLCPLERCICTLLRDGFQGAPLGSLSRHMSAVCRLRQGSSGGAAAAASTAAAAAAGRPSRPRPGRARGGPLPAAAAALVARPLC